MYVVNHFWRPEDADHNVASSAMTYSSYDEAKVRFDRIVARVTKRTKKKYLHWTELKWHKDPTWFIPEQTTSDIDFFQVWDDKGKSDPYLKNTTVETVMLEVQRSVTPQEAEEDEMPSPADPMEEIADKYF